MSEEELIYILENWFLPKAVESRKQGLADIEQIKFMEAIQGLLDLYNKEKMNSSKLSEQLNKEKEKNQNALKWINNFMDNGNTIGCNFGDLMILLDILEEE